MTAENDDRTAGGEPVSEQVLTVIRIQASPRWSVLDLAELWHFRELLYFLVWRTVKVRYKQTALGVLWVVLQPLVAAALLTLVFGHFAGLPSGNLPFITFAMAGILPWNYFASALTHGSNSLVTNAPLITKVYFPRILIPLSSTLAGLVDLAIGCVVLLVVSVFLRQPVGVAAVALPLWMLLGAAACLGPTLWLSALNVRYRDVAQALPFVVQLGLFITPVFYPTSLVPPRWRWSYSLNPMVGVLEGFRCSIGGSCQPSGTLLQSVVVVTLLVVSGIIFFRRMERSFADVV